MKANLVILVSMLTCPAVICWADYNLTFPTFADGGGTSSGGVYTLESTIGESVVGTFSGGSYVLYGGFWHPGLIQLNYTVSGSDLILTWSDPSLTLEEATSPGGPWTVLPGATSPYVVSTTGPMKYYRLVR